MSVKHDIGCRCSRCLEYNTLSGTAFDLSRRLTTAVSEGRPEAEANMICSQLEEANARAAQLKHDLGR